MRRSFGSFVREKREKLQREHGRQYSLRQVAKRIGIEPSYLSRMERDRDIPPGEGTIVSLASELGVNSDALLAMAGKVSSDLQAVVRKRPELFGDLIRQLKTMPNRALLKLVREVRDGEW